VVFAAPRQRERTVAPRSLLKSPRRQTAPEVNKMVAQPTGARDAYHLLRYSGGSAVAPAPPQPYGLCGEILTWRERRMPAAYGTSGESTVASFRNRFATKGGHVRCL